jgi:hypothetical protein
MFTDLQYITLTPLSTSPYGVRSTLYLRCQRTPAGGKVLLKKALQLLALATGVPSVA